MTEERLSGGFVNAVVRAGNTVRRPVSPRATFVHGLLRHLEDVGWAGAPRHLGVDNRGREMLSFVDGHVPWRREEQADVVRGEESLAAVARLVREFHDLTAGTTLAGDGEVVCHNDLSPRNTVYRRGDAGWRPVAFLDWDLAAPGARISDVAHVCWQYVALGPHTPGVDEAGRLVRVITDAYGLADRSDLVDTILWWQDRCWRGIEAGADAGQPAMVRLRDLGAARDVRDAYRWTDQHALTLRAALR